MHDDETELKSLFSSDVIFLPSLDPDVLGGCFVVADFHHAWKSIITRDRQWREMKKQNIRERTRMKNREEKTDKKRKKKYVLNDYQTGTNMAHPKPTINKWDIIEGYDKLQWPVDKRKEKCR